MKIHSLFAPILALSLLAGCQRAPVRLPTVSPSVLVTTAAPTIEPYTLTPSPRPSRTMTPTITLTPTVTRTLTPSPTLVPATAAAFQGTPPAAPAEPIRLDSAGQTVQLAQWGDGTLQSGQYSPDSRLLALNTSLGTYLYQVEGLKRVRLIPTSAGVSAARFSPGSDSLALGLQSGAVALYRVADGALVRTYQSEGGLISDLTFSPDGATLYALQAETRPGPSQAQLLLSLRGWAVLTGRPTLERPLNGMARAFFSGSGQRLLQQAGNTVEIRDISSGARLAQLDLKTILGRDLVVSRLALSADGSALLVFSGTYAALLRVDDSRAPIQLQEALPLPEYEPPPSCPWQPQPEEQGEVPVESTEEGGAYDYYFYDETLTPYPTATPTATSMYNAVTTPVISSAAFSADGKTLAIARRPGIIDFYQVSDGTRLRSFSSSTRQIFFAPDGQNLLAISGPFRQTLEQHRLPEGTLNGVLTSGMRPFTSLSIAPDGGLVASGAEDGTVQVWDLKTGRPAFSLPAAARDLSFNPDGTALAVGLTDGGLRVWTVNPLRGKTVGKAITLENIHLDAIQRVIYGPGGQQVITAALDCRIRVWNTGSWTQGSTIKLASSEANQAVRGLALSPDGSALAGFPRASVYYFYDTKTGEELRELPIDAATRFNLAVFSPDGNMLASAGAKIFLWDLSAHALRYQVEGAAQSLVFSPDGSLLAAGMLNGDIRLLNAADGTLAAVLSGHRAAALRLAFSADGRYLVSTSQDGTVRVWGVKQ